MISRKDFINSNLPNKDELLSLFRPNDPLIIFDIGACEGEDSIRYSNLFPNASIHAFEPLPKNIEHIKKNILAYQKKNVHVNEEALSDKIGVSVFSVSSGTPEQTESAKDWDYGNKSGSLLKPDKVLQAFPWLKFKEEIEVRTNTLDHYLNENKIAVVDIIHMDVQGAEMMVLQGAGERLKHVKAIWLEVETVPLYKDQPLKKDVMSFMKKHNFHLLKSKMNNISGDQLYVNRKYFPAEKKFISKVSEKLKTFFYSRRSHYRKTSFSQSGEDLIVKFIFDFIGIQNPSYIDIGAHHPYFLNNTAIFYESGSRGINIEPNDENITLFNRYRKHDVNLNIGIAKEPGLLDYYYMSAPTLNTFSKEEAQNFESENNYKIKRVVKKEVDTLQGVITKYHEGKFPDLLSLDVEGLEEDIIYSIDYENNFPSVICIETISYSEKGLGEKNHELIDFIKSKNYLAYADTNINSIFVRKEKWIRS
jgi:FkbM family methyltransferase